MILLCSEHSVFPIPFTTVLTLIHYTLHDPAPVTSQILSPLSFPFTRFAHWPPLFLRDIFYHRTFVLFVPSAWNTLPSDIPIVPSLTSFKPLNVTSSVRPSLTTLFNFTIFLPLPDPLLWFIFLFNMCHLIKRTGIPQRYCGFDSRPPQ